MTAGNVAAYAMPTTIPSTMPSERESEPVATASMAVPIEVISMPQAGRHRWLRGAPRRPPASRCRRIASMPYRIQEASTKDRCRHRFIQNVGRESTGDDGDAIHIRQRVKTSFVPPELAAMFSVVIESRAGEPRKYDGRRPGNVRRERRRCIVRWFEWHAGDWLLGPQ